MGFGWKLPGRHHRHHLDQAADHSRAAKRRRAGLPPGATCGACRACGDRRGVGILRILDDLGKLHIWWIYVMFSYGIKKHKGTWKWVRGTFMDDICVFFNVFFLLCSYYNLLLVQRTYAFWLKRFIDAYSRTVELHDKWQQQVNACV